MGVTRSFWDDRRTFVTGHTGFKGAWLATWLRALGAKVSGYSLPPATNPNLHKILWEFVGDDDIGDVRDPAALRQALTRAEPEVVFHLAAQSLVRPGYREPLMTFETNVMGTVNLLEAVRTLPSVRAVVVVTSDKCYKNNEWLWAYREGEPLGGSDPYSASKACAEIATAAFRDSYFSEASSGGALLATARAGNVIGGGDWCEDRLVPDLVRAIAAGKPAMIRNPRSVRPWQHVLCPLDGYMALAERLHAGDAKAASAWNFGPPDDDVRDVDWVATDFARRWGRGAEWRLAEGPMPHEAVLLRVDSSRARWELGWKPKYTLEDAIAKTVEWYRAHADGRDMREFTRKQIEHYVNQ